MAIKIAYNAGHILSTPGKRLPKELDPNETREWVLNDRVAREFAYEMGKYDGAELRRLDDPAGVEDIDIDVRVARAEAWGADYYLSFHHNAAGRIFRGGGTVAYIYRPGGEGEALGQTIHRAVTDALDYRGDRAVPIAPSNLYEVRKTTMPAVLMEYLFMDSAVDAPIILGEGYSEKVGRATAHAVADYLGLKRKEGFQDVEPGRYYAEPVAWGVERGIVRGKDEFTFGPHDLCTRAEAITFLWRLMGCPEPGCDAPVPFEDVDGDGYHIDALAWAYDCGVIEGVSDTAFAPDGSCTRGQFVTMLYRLAGCPIAPDGVKDTPFTDLDANAFYCDAALWAVRAGIVVGLDENTFGPDEPVTRAMAVTMLARLVGQ